MKKALLILTCCLMSLGMQAQTTHLKFMGIPLDGTITIFQSQLAKKNIELPKEHYSLPAGVQLFEGVFAGDNAQFYVYYNSKTKGVYRTRCAITFRSSIQAEAKRKEYEKNLTKKYEGCTGYQKEIQPGKNQFILDVVNEEGVLLGHISLYVSESRNLSMDKSYILNVDYEDIANSKENERLNMDDL